MPESAFPQAVILTAATQTATFGVSGYGGIGIQIQGTFVGTLTFEGSVDGAEFAALAMTSADDPTTVVTTATAPGVFVGSVAGLTTVRARMSAYTSGSASVLSRAVLESPGGAAGGGGGGGGLDELTGDVTAGPGTGAQAATIAAGAVTLAKMADIATDRLIGRDTAATGVPEALTVGSGIEFSGSGGIRTTTPVRTRALGFVFPGASLAPAAYMDIYVPYACTITAATVMGDVVGDVVFGVAASNSFATAPVTSIVASAPPTLTGDDGSQDTTLTGWTTAVGAGTRMRCTVTSTSGLAWASLTLTVTV